MSRAYMQTDGAKTKGGNKYDYNLSQKNAGAVDKAYIPNVFYGGFF